MGPYCSFCDQRCFVPNPCSGSWLYATCSAGKANDRRQVGHNIDDINQLIEEYVEVHGFERERAVSEVRRELFEATAQQEALDQGGE